MNRNIISALLVVLILFGCNSKTPVDKPIRERYVEAEIHEDTNEEIIQIPHVTPCIAFDYRKAKKYASFDEHQLKGIGKVKGAPFVYVIKDKDTVLVKRSDKEYVLKYVKEKEYIHNRVAFDMVRIDAPPVKEIGYNLARIYDRFILSDSIIELEHVFSGDNNSVTYTDKALFIKFGKTCVGLSSPSDDNFGIQDIENPYKEIRAIIAKYNSGSYKKEELSETKYFLKEDKKFYYYVYNFRQVPPPYTKKTRLADTIFYLKTPLGYYGIEPGVGEDEIDIYELMMMRGQVLK